MLIDSIYINNFKSIRESGKIEIRPLNVLVGANGVGKSNFIGFFKLLHSIVKQRLPHYIAEHGYADKILHFGRKKSKELRGMIVFQHERKGLPANSYDFVLKPDADNGLYFQLERGGYNRALSSMGNKTKEDWDYTELDSVGRTKSPFKTINKAYSCL